MNAALSLSLVMSIEGMLSETEAALLFRLASEATGPIVEIGSYRGRSTVALALGSRAGANVPVYAIDPHEDFTEPDGFVFGRADAVAFTQALIEAAVVDIVRVVELPASAVTLNRPISLLWIDGNHDQALDDARRFIWNISGGGRIAFHDSHLDPVRVAIAFSDSAGFQQVETVGGITVMDRVDRD
jgi:predicted O-methyltransferase YrrM